MNNNIQHNIPAIYQHNYSILQIRLLTFHQKGFTVVVIEWF